MKKDDLRDSTIIRYDFEGFTQFIIFRAVANFIFLATVFLVVLFIYFISMKIITSTPNMNIDWFIQKLRWVSCVSFVIVVGTGFHPFCFKVYKLRNVYNLVNLTIKALPYKERSEEENPLSLIALEDFLIVPKELLDSDFSFSNCDKNLAKYFIDEKELEKQSLFKKCMEKLWKRKF